VSDEQVTGGVQN